MNINNKSKTKFFQEYYFLIIPIAITFLIYLVSLSYGFRNFDEDILIKNFYVKKTLGEYLEKFFLIHLGGASEAYGFTFSSIKNIHVSILGMPLLYLISFFFQAKPFLFHLWSLLLHCLALYFFIWFCFELTQNKYIALFSGLIWTLHPTNVEPVIWATNWPQLLGATFYFYTLRKVVSLTNKGLASQVPIVFVLLATTIQILFTEHAITLPFAIFFTVLYQMKYLNNEKNENSNNVLKVAFKTSLPSFIVIFLYFILRTIIASKALVTSTQSSYKELIERVIFLSPQVFLHQLKLVFFPSQLTIDQLDLLTLDKTYLGAYHLFCIAVFVLFLFSIFYFRKKVSYLSFGFIFYLLTLLPFLQIIPLYSIVAERYNYLGTAFVVFGIATVLFKILRASNKLYFLTLIILVLLLVNKTYTRITEWKNSSTLFFSTANTSKSLLKKGIWTYNLAISQEDNSKKEDLLNLSTNLLKLFIENEERDTPKHTPGFITLSKYELDRKSLLAKAALRIATNFEILNQKESELEYLLKALSFSRADTRIQSLIYKDLGTFYFQKIKFDKALDYYNKSFFISPNPTLSYAIALCYLKLKDTVNYEKYLKEAAQVISPYNVAPFKTYGQFLELSKLDYPNAIKYYKIATLLENNPEPYILLASLYLKQNQLASACKIINNGLYSFPENSSLLYLHGSIEIGKGNLNFGIEDLKKVIIRNKTPKDIKIEACNILVNIFLKQKNFEEASKYNECILMIDPKNQEALKNKLLFGSPVIR